MESTCKDWKFSGVVDGCLEGLTKVMIDSLGEQSRGLAKSVAREDKRTGMASSCH